MKPIISIVASLAILFLALTPYAAKADHCGGGEISYAWLADSSYIITFKFYRDCAGIQAPTTVPLCYTNSCNGQGGTTPLYKIATLPDGRPNGSEVGTGCAGFPSKCLSASSIIPGFHEWWYSDTVTLPSRCNAWKFSVAISARSLGIQNIPSAAFYVEATLNNLAAQGNSSPIFSVKPIPFVCINKPYTYNNGGVDINGDSMTYETIQPLGGGGCPANPGPINFLTGSPPYNILNNPFQTNNTYSIDAATGQIKFTPSLGGKNTLAIRVKEYRNGVLIGSVIRDIQTQVMNCNVASVDLDLLPATISGGSLVNNQINVCANTPLNFCFDIVSADPAALLVVSDNHVQAIPSSFTFYSGQQDDSIRGCFTWTPGFADAGLKVLSVLVKDSTCAPPGIAVTQAFTIPIDVITYTQIFTADTAICPGNAVPFKAVGVTNFHWTVLPGGSPLTSLTCTTCFNPIATPSVTTTYVALSDSSCIINEDTITVTVKPSTVLDSNITKNNGPLCVGDSLKLMADSLANIYIYSWTGPGGFTSTVLNPIKPNILFNEKGYYKMVMYLNDCTILVDSTEVVIDEFPDANIIPTLPDICMGESVEIKEVSVNPAATQYFWDVNPGAIISGAGTKTITAQWYQSGIKKVYIKTVNGICVSRDTADVNVLPTPLASFETNFNVCAGKFATILPKFQANSFYYWTVDDLTVQDTIYKESFQLLWPTPGKKKISLHVKDATCESTIDTAINVRDNPSGKIQYENGRICYGDTVVLHTQKGDYYNYEWSPQSNLLGSNSSDVAMKVQAGTPIHLKVTNEWGCSISDSTYINTSVCCKVVFPDAFTPNGDGRNDKFKVLLADEHTIHTFIIVNRTGQVIFESKNPADGWDGTYKGVPQDAGTYFYYLKYLCQDGEVLETKGNVILIR